MIPWSVLFASLRANKTRSGNLLTVLNTDWHLESKIRRIYPKIFTLIGLTLRLLEGLIIDELKLFTVNIIQVTCSQWAMWSDLGNLPFKYEKMSQKVTSAKQKQ